ncbi:MAG: response regulator transcription factor [Gemmatimonadaceae bacterium]
MGIVATVLSNQLRLSRLRSALRERYTLVPCADWKELLQACADQPVSIAVVDVLSDGQTNLGFDSLRQLKRRYPSVTVVLYVATPPTRPRDLFEAGRFGVDGLVLADHEDEPRQMLALLEQAETRAVIELVRRELTGVKPTVRDATLVAVGRAHQRLSTEGLAKVLGIRRKTLTERLVQQGFPAAQRLLAWGRLIVAARMLEDDERSADSVAMALDYPSGSAFRNTCQRYVHATPHEIRARGGASFVIRAFLAETRSGATGAAESSAGLPLAGVGAAGGGTGI